MAQTNHVLRRGLMTTLLTLLVACSSGGSSSPPADSGAARPEPVEAAELVLTGGQVYTVDKAYSRAEAVAVRDGRIVYVGGSAGVQPFIGNGTRVIRLRGKTVLPGLHDSHLHPLEAGSEVAGTCYIDPTEDILTGGFQAKLRQCAPQQRGGIDWVLGFGHSIFQLLELPESVRPRDILDRAIPDWPVALMEETSHSVWVNSAALQMAGIDRDTPNPTGGIIARDSRGNATGLLLDNAGDQIFDLALMPPTNRLLNLHYEGLLYSLDLIARNGITSIANARVYTRRGYLEAWQRAENEGTLSARTILGLWAYPNLEPGESDQDQIERLSALYHNDPDSLLRVSQIKFYSDGIHINETAATLEPYPPSERLPFTVSADHRGINYYDQQRLADYISALELVGFDMHIHTIGDRGVREALNAIEIAIQRNGGSLERRHRLTHLEQVDPADYSRFAELGVIADMQVAGDWVLPEPGQPMDGFIPVKSLMDAGARITLSSDWDVSDLSPFVGIQNSLQRAEESLPDVATALRAYTIDAAYLMRSEDRTGSIEVGKLADMVIVDRDIHTVERDEIASTRVLLTLLGGEEVYRAASFRD